MCLLKISPGIFRRSFMLHQILDKCICLLQWQPRCFLRVSPWCDQRETGSKSKMLLFLLLSLLGGWALTGSALSRSLLSCTTPGAASGEAARAAGGGGRGRSSGRAPGRQQPQSLHFGCKTKPQCYCNWHCQSGNEDAGGGCVCVHTQKWCWDLCVQQFRGFLFVFVFPGKTEGAATWIMRACRRILLTKDGIHQLSHGSNQRCLYFCILDKFFRCLDITFPLSLQTCKIPHLILYIF